MRLTTRTLIAFRILIFSALMVALILGLLACGRNSEPKDTVIRHKIYYSDTGEYFDYVEKMEIPSLGLHDCYYFYTGSKGNVDCDWSTRTEPYHLAK